MDLVKRVAEILSKASYGIAFTGAGISTESNIPDFRGSQGLWKKFDPRMASRSYFEEDPKGFWSFYAMRYNAIAGAAPNDGHLALAELERRGYIDSVITQNIDTLHTKAGSKSVIELHGNIIWSHCDICSAERRTIECIEEFERSGNPPTCRSCGGLMRPSVVLFEEPVRLMETAIDMAYKSDCCLVVGSSLTVYPAAMVPEVVKRQGGDLIIINMDPTPLDYRADVVIRDKASVILKKLLEFLI
ncbi:MAG: NAD-dependent deacylase [Candidatus Methanomethyliales bacterium]|nr:NAD-dependent deacylase [Candidatus Methanomethylicales archaeon]